MKMACLIELSKGVMFVATLFWLVYVAACAPSTLERPTNKGLATTLVTNISNASNAALTSIFNASEDYELSNETVSIVHIVHGKCRSSFSAVEHIVILIIISCLLLVVGIIFWHYPPKPNNSAFVVKHV